MTQPTLANRRFPFTGAPAPTPIPPATHSGSEEAAGDLTRSELAGGIAMVVRAMPEEKREVGAGDRGLPRHLRPGATARSAGRVGALRGARGLLHHKS